MVFINLCILVHWTKVALATFSSLKHFDEINLNISKARKQHYDEGSDKNAICAVVFSQSW